MDYTKLLGLGASDKVVLQWLNPDSATHWGYISVLNTNHWHELENITIKANNIRYAVHDDLWDGQDRFIRAKNCNFIVSGNTTRCWGAGTNGGYEGVFEHCKFIMDLYEPFIQSNASIHPFSLHDNSYNVGRDSHVKMVNCVFYTPYTERLRYWSSSWEQIEYNASYPMWDNEKLDYAVNDCVNTPEDPEHSYKCLYAGSQVPPCIKGRESFSFGYRESEATGYLYASIENCECNTYLEVCEVKERLTGFCNIWGHVPVLYQESADNKFVIMDFRNNN
jgi:hypothetical protein